MANASSAEEEKKAETDLCKSVSEVSLRKDVQHYSSDRTLNKRSLILDEESFENTFLICAVCRDSFRNPRKPPKLLPCHHSFCQLCIQQLFLTEISYRQRLAPSMVGMPTAVSIHCPTCRGTFITTEENLKTLPTDHRIVQLLDFVKHTDRCTVSFCSKHKTQPLNFFCEPCIKPVCHDCTVLEHKEKEGHIVIDLNEALEKYSPVLDTAITEMESELGILIQKQETLDAATKKLENTRTELLKNIHDSFGRLKEQIAERERELESIAENEVNKEKKKLDEKVEQVSSRRKAVEENVAKLKQAKGETNIEDMFNCHQQLRDYKSHPLGRIREVDDGVMTTFAFSSRDESYLSSRITNFGDIKSQTESTLKTGLSTGLTRRSSFR